MIRIGLFFSLALVARFSMAATVEATPSIWIEGGTAGVLSFQGFDAAKPIAVTAYRIARSGEMLSVWQTTVSGGNSIQLPPLPFSTAGYYAIKASAGPGQSGAPASVGVSVVARAVSRVSGTPLFGVNTHFAQRSIPDAAYGLLSMANADLIRDQWVWPAVEASAGVIAVPTTPSGGLSHQKQMLAAHGLKILHNCAYGNRAYDGGGFPRSTAGIAAFARYCAFVAQNFGASLYGSEIWNESTAVDAASVYGPLAAATATALKKVAGNAEIIQGGGAGIGGGVDPIYEETVYKTIGAACCTGHSIHPYMTNPDVGYLAHNSRLIDLVSGQSVVSLDFAEFWSDYVSHEFKKTTASNITELGWYTVLDGKDGVSETKQAAYISRALIHASKPTACTRVQATTVAAIPTPPCMATPSASTPDLKTFFVYDLQDDGPNRTNPEHNFGLLHADLTPKMSYSAFAQAAGVLRGSTFHKAFQFDPLSLANALLYKTANGEGLLVLWTAEFRPNGIAKSDKDFQYQHESSTQALLSLRKASDNMAYPGSSLQCREWDGQACVLNGASVAVSNLPIFVQVHGSIDDVQVSELPRPPPVKDLTAD